VVLDKFSELEKVAVFAHEVGQSAAELRDAQQFSAQFLIAWVLAEKPPPVVLAYTSAPPSDVSVPISSLTG
jgi:hypothetical protein